MQCEMIRYLLSGVCTTLVNIGVFSGLRYGMGIRMQTANVSSIVAAILFAFIVNKWFVFRTETNGRVGKEFLRFAGMRGLSLGAEVLGMQILTMVHVPDMTAKIFMQVIIISMNYVISKCYVFKRQEDER
ncbi:MAG: GtrA family protein [Lachnospiraceae bacterium]|nr:GtrA family protein [Lachnospiraceae bacterium]